MTRRDRTTRDPTARDRKSRRHVLAAMLRHVPFDGWSAAALDRALSDCAVSPAEGRRMFPDGARELLAAFLAEGDRRITVALAEQDLAPLKVRERVALAVRLRIEAQAGEREAVRRALGALALPSHAGLGARALWATVDAIWRGIGDRSHDFNFYTKRAILAGVYASTLLAWIADGSEDGGETWAFLDRRVADALRIGGRLGRLIKGGAA